MTDPLISVEEAKTQLGDPATVFLDASWTFDGGPEFQASGYIPGHRIVLARRERSSRPQPSPQYKERSLAWNDPPRCLSFSSVVCFPRSPPDISHRSNVS